MNLTHDTIWLAIDRLAESCGYSTSGLAKRSGLDPTSFNRSKRIGIDGKPRWPSTESIARVLNATNSTMSEFMELMVDPATPKDLPRIPLLALSIAGKSGHFDDKGAPKGDAWDHINFPHTLDESDEDLYALEITTTDFLPIFREGDRLVLLPNATLRKGDRIVIKTANNKILVKELHRQTASKIECRSLLGKDENISLTPTDILWIARIMWVSQ